jgi:transcriptional regulator with XRE-family HTH domain
MALACRTGISQGSISAIERGRKAPKTKTLALFAEVLGCSMDYFFEDE